MAFLGRRKGEAWYHSAMLLLLNATLNMMDDRTFLTSRAGLRDSGRSSFIVLLILLLWGLPPGECNAQVPVVFEGTVLDAEGQSPIAFATVSLLRAADSTLLSGTTTNSSGQWQLSSAQLRERVLLRASFLGYTTTYSEAFAVTAGRPPFLLTLGTSPALLAEIEVTGKQLTDVHRLDRQAYRAEQFANAQGGTVVDVLANLPSVSVNGQGEITVRGTNGFLVLIDGQPVQGDPAVTLAQIPANSVEEIELITTPGAKYDPDGKAGIINVKTRAESLNGWSGIANINIGLPALRNYDPAEAQQRYALDVSANYRSNQWNFGIGADYRRNDTGGLRDGYVNTLIAGTLTEFPSFGERSHDRENYTGRLSIGYTPDQRNTLRLGLLGGKQTVARTADILYRDQRRAELPDSEQLSPTAYYESFLARGTVSGEGRQRSLATYYNENLRIRRGDFFLSTLDYTRTLANDRQLSVAGLFERSLLGGPTDNVILPQQGALDTIAYQFNTNDNPLSGYRFSVDYTDNSHELTWETGYQFRYLNHPGDFLYLDRDFDNGAFVANPLFTNGIVLRRSIHAAYGQISGATERLEYSAGLRAEYFDRSVRLNAPDTTFQLDRFSLYPSASLKYALRDGLFARAGYSRRIDRTTTFKMTPFPEREHNETLEQGDAELLPELTDQVELGLVANFGNHSAFGNIYYRRTRDVINRVNTVFNDTILNRIYTNVGIATALGVEGGLTVYPVESWRLFLSGNVYRYGIMGNLFGDPVDTGNWVYSLSVLTDFTIRRAVAAQIGLNYLSETITAQGRDSRFFNPYLNLRYDWPDKRLTFTLQWQNISLGGLLNNNRQRITTARDNFFTTTNYIYETDILRLGVNYALTSRKGESKIPKREFGEREF